MNAVALGLGRDHVRRGARVLAVAVVALLALVLAPSGTADAHAVLVGSSPADNEVLDATPDAVELRFSEPVELLDDSLQLFDANGARIDAGPVDQRDGDNTIVLHVTTELEGSVVVSWRAVSLDSHVISGAYTFAVGARTPVDPALVSSADADTTWPDLFVGVGAWLTFVGVAGVVGGAAALLWLSPTSLAEPRPARILRISAAAGLVGTLLMLGAQSALIANGPLDADAWREVLDLSSGRWWFVRLVGFALVLAGLFVVPRRGSRGAWRALVGLSAVALVPTTVLGGHAVAGDHVAVAVVSTILHVLAMAVWVGGLTVLVLVVATRDLAPVLARFSPRAMICVAVLLVTGFVNSWRQLEGLDDLLDTAFGRWLVVKLVIVAAVLAAAGSNTLVLRRERGSGTAVRRSAAFESVGMAVVLAATAGLANATPPASVVTSSAPVSVTAVQSDLRARIDVIPARTGGTTLNVMVYADGTDLSAADEITVTALLPAEELGPLELDVASVGPNQLSTDAADFPTPGDWTVEVTARLGQFDQAVFTSVVTIE